jgi:rhodanese-related sulfurtransferase
MEQVDVQTLKKWRDGGQSPILVDVREKDEWDLVRLEGSEWMPLSRFMEEAPRKLQPHVPVALICHHGVRSFHAGQYLESLGFARVINIQGGIDAWAKCVDRSLPTY